MAQRETSTGLSIGQLVTLTFGFLVASALIFAFGFWVGYDAAQRRLAREQQFVRLPVGQAPTRLPTATARESTRTPAVTAGPFEPVQPVTPVTTVRAGQTPGVAVPGAIPSPVPPTPRPSPPPSSTPTRRPPTPTRTAIPAAAVPTPTAGEEAAGAVWSVQTGATTDPVQAVVLARNLRQKGYDAFTVTGKVDGTMWYRVRVGHFPSRVQAKVLELRLKQEEGLTEAFVVSQ
jgi:cell division septation protein DedD